MWVTLIISLVSTIVSILCQPKPPKPKPQAFTSEAFPKCQDGTAKSIAFGQVKSKDFIVIYTGLFRTKAIVVKGGKK